MEAISQMEAMPVASSSMMACDGDADKGIDSQRHRQPQQNQQQRQQDINPNQAPMDSVKPELVHRKDAVQCDRWHQQSHQQIHQQQTQQAQQMDDPALNKENHHGGHNKGMPQSCASPIVTRPLNQIQIIQDHFSKPSLDQAPQSSQGPQQSQSSQSAPHADADDKPTMPKLPTLTKSSTETKGRLNGAAATGKAGIEKEYGGGKDQNSPTARDYQKGNSHGHGHGRGGDPVNDHDHDDDHDEDGQHHHHHHHFKIKKLFRKLLHNFAKIGHALTGHHHDEHHHQHQNHNNHHKHDGNHRHRHKHQQHHRVSSRRLRHKVSTLLQGCTTAEEHWEKVFDVIDQAKQLCGAEGLREIGFEFRTIPVPHDTKESDETIRKDVSDGDAATANGNRHQEGRGRLQAQAQALDEAEPQSELEDDAEIEDADEDEDKNKNHSRNKGGGNDAGGSTIKATGTGGAGTGEAAKISNGDSHADAQQRSANPNCGEAMHDTNAKDTQHADKDAQENEHENEHEPHRHHIHRSSSASIRESYMESLTMTRLFHIATNTMITTHNRQKFIADGDMYDAVARLCQHAAQETMREQGNLEWVVVSEAGNNAEPIRALVSAAIAKNREHALNQFPTLLIATGRGKVRAGIFSRQHLMASGMECSTALPLVHEANRRKMNIVMLDPNVHGDRMGMSTFQTSMTRLFKNWEDDHTASSNFDFMAPSEMPGSIRSDDDERHHGHKDPLNLFAPATSPQPSFEVRDLFVLSHSQSGAQLARFLLDKSEIYLPHIRAIAFTDSTHNIQWTRKNENLHHLLQSDRCIYYKSARESSEHGSAGGSINDQQSHEGLETAGEEVDTDEFWKHRFGSISTRCAGTSEHSLTNWFARTQIWNHFDGFLHANNGNTGGNNGGNSSIDGGMDGANHRNNAATATATATSVRVDEKKTSAD